MTTDYYYKLYACNVTIYFRWLIGFKLPCRLNYFFFSLLCAYLFDTLWPHIYSFEPKLTYIFIYLIFFLLFWYFSPSFRIAKHRTVPNQQFNLSHFKVSFFFDVLHCTAFFQQFIENEVREKNRVNVKLSSCI